MFRKEYGLTGEWKLIMKSKNTHEHDLLVDLHKLKEEFHKLKEEIRSDHAINPQVEKNIRVLGVVLLIEEECGAGVLQRANEIPSKEIHYTRNQNMPLDSLPQSPAVAKELGWDGSVEAACHQFTSSDRSNKKYVSPDGKSEVIFDRSGNIVTASEDYGTYNFCDSRQDPVGHFYQDVLPWLLWGNDETDSTNMRQRLKALIVYGSLEAVQTHETI